MEDQTNIYIINPKRKPWNKGKLIGQKPPLQPKHVWAIRTPLQINAKIRDLALFNLAIDSKLRGCDVVRLKVDDIDPTGKGIGENETFSTLYVVISDHRQPKTDAT